MSVSHPLHYILYTPSSAPHPLPPIPCTPSTTSTSHPLSPILNTPSSEPNTPHFDVNQMIKSLGAPVEVATFERSSFARQFLALSQAGVVVAPHGANLVNALLLPPGAVAVEVYPLPIRYRYGEWAEYLQRSGTKCVEFCVNDKNPDLPCNLSKRGKPYPYTNVAVDLDRLRPVVQAALDMVLRTMAEP